VITMAIQSVNSGESTANKSVPKACEDGPNAETGASDAIFNILMAQLLGSTVQNNQQTAPDTSQATAADSAVSGKNGSVMLVAQDQVPLLPTTGQQAIDKSSSIPGGQKPADVPTETTKFSEQLNVDEKNDILMAQLLGSPVQNNQQTALDASKATATDSAVSGKNSSATLVAQDHVPLLPTTGQQAIDKSSSILGGQKPADVTIKAEALAIPEKTEAAGLTPSQNDTTEKPGQSAPNIAPGLGKTDYNIILFQHDKNANMGQDAGEEGSWGKGQNDPTPAKTDFLSLMQQGQSSVQSPVQHQPAFTAVAPNTDAPSSPVPLQHQGADPADLIDHAVSTVKDGSRLAVKLEPDGLGKLDINLRLDKGTVSAQIHVSSDVTKNLIENNKQQMMNALVGEGLSVGGFTVSLNHKDAGDGFAESGQGDDQNKNSTSLRVQAVGDAGRTGARGMVSIYV